MFRNDVAYFITSESGAVGDMDYPEFMMKHFITNSHIFKKVSCILPPINLRSSPLAAGIDMDKMMAESRDFLMEDGRDAPKFFLTILPRSRKLKAVAEKIIETMPQIIDPYSGTPRELASHWPWADWANKYGTVRPNELERYLTDNEEKQVVKTLSAGSVNFLLTLKSGSRGAVFSCEWDDDLQMGTAARLTQPYPDEIGEWTVVDAKRVGKSPFDAHLITMPGGDVWGCFGLCFSIYQAVTTRQEEPAIYFTANNIHTFYFMLAAEYRRGQRVDTGLEYPIKPKLRKL